MRFRTTADILSPWLKLAGKGNASGLLERQALAFTFMPCFSLYVKIPAKRHQGGFIDATYSDCSKAWDVFYREQDNGFVAKHDFWGGAEAEVEWETDDWARVRVTSGGFTPKEGSNEDDIIFVSFSRWAILRFFKICRANWSMSSYKSKEGKSMLRNMTTIYLHRGGKVLLLYRVGSRVVEPSWCGIGGHFEPEELNDPQACALRELLEETGIGAQQVENMQLRYITLRLKNREIRQNYYFFANLKTEDFPLPACPEGTLEWVKWEAVLGRNMPVTARQCLEHYMGAGRHDAVVYAGVSRENGIEFAALSEF